MPDINLTEARRIHAAAAEAIGHCIEDDRIVRAVDIFPALLDELERLQADNVELRAEVGRLRAALHEFTTPQKWSRT